MKSPPIATGPVGPARISRFHRYPKIPTGPTGPVAIIMAGVTFDTQAISCCISGRPYVCKKVRQHSPERDLAQLRSLFGNVPRPMRVRDMFRAWFSERELQGRYLAKSRQLLRLRDREEEPAYSDRTRRTCMRGSRDFTDIPRSPRVQQVRSPYGFLFLSTSLSDRKRKSTRCSNLGNRRLPLCVALVLVWPAGA